MTLYALILIIHVTATFILFAALATEALSLRHLRRAATVSEAQAWLAPWPGMHGYVALSGITILLTGVVLVLQEGAAKQAWPKVAATALVITVLLGAISGRRMRAIRRLDHAEMISRLRDPQVKRSIIVRIALFFGIFILVSIKPGLWGAIATILGAIVIGLIASFGGVRPAHSSIGDTARHVSTQRTEN
jgi:hypothetical protein